MENKTSKVKRCYLGENITSPYKTNSCQNCAYLQQLLDLKIKEINDTIISQNKVIMEALATQKVVSQKLLRQERDNNNLRTVFPVQNTAALTQLNGVINEENRHLYINVMKSLLKGRLPKTLTEVFSLEVIVEFNVDGTHGKYRLKDSNNVFDSLMDAIRSIDEGDPEKELRLAMQTIKKRHFHNVCVQNKARNH